MLSSIIALFLSYTVELEFPYATHSVLPPLSATYQSTSIFFRMLKKASHLPSSNAGTLPSFAGNYDLRDGICVGDEIRWILWLPVLEDRVGSI